MPSRIVIPNSGSRGAASTKPTVYRAQVVERAFQILEAVGKNGADSGVAEIAAALQLHKSTVHRLLCVLERARYVERTEGNGRYRLGASLYRLGMLAAPSMDLAAIARSYLHSLAQESGEAAHLGVLRGGEVISIAHAESSRALQTPSTVGRRSPAHCTSLGKAILASLPEEELKELVLRTGLKTYTPKTIVRFADLKRELRRVRNQGYALDEEEIEEGLKCIGAPIWDGRGVVIAAVSIAGPVSRLRV
ncbi:MAG: IclR family transcriptional regulator, partial [Nitrospiraceae bacterium]